ncbi:hypothetical protein IV498_14945 [Paenarthrobacter sp. Z7-10]|uniref:hypothetical protein n=1 Tax=Paenarthrobacter sp. Z7-10 TaxID=2787635 RepID=UPI0022A904A5|nr:hypothetical protein [Paenarthrobacter sp. Z7-10]MCZ2404438.1 hypothetical protein [Paenarthrobacter sp. Z7-10]
MKQTGSMNGTSDPGRSTPPETAAEGCSIAEGFPGCDAGPVGRAGFVVREIRAALARRRPRKRAAETVSRPPRAGGQEQEGSTR